MDGLRRQLIALVLLSALLVSQLQCQALSIQDSLPALELDEEPAPASAEKVPEPKVSTGPQAAAETTLTDISTTKPSGEEPKTELVAPSSASPPLPDKEGSLEPKVVPSETKPEAKTIELTGAEENKPPTVESRNDPTSQVIAELANETKQAPAPRANPVNDDYLNILLANKNDSDNDLAASSSGRSGDQETKRTTIVELDSPVDTNKPIDERFHYSIGSAEKPALAEPESAVATEKSVEAKKDIAPETATAPAAASAQPEELAKPQEKVAPAETVKESSVDGKKEPEDKVKAVINEAASENVSFKKEQAEVDKVKPDEATRNTTQAPTSAASSTPSSELAKKEETNKAAEKPQEAANTTNSSTVAAKSESGEKPSGMIPSILSSAIGTVLGNALSGKDKAPSSTSTTVAPTPPTASASSTTKAPSSTRKSTTDKWDRWSPSTSTSTPPTRRRPILPSIRRRFRPYNRFSPFPWGGADAYSPIGDMDFIPAGEFGPRPTTTSPSLRPRRRGSSTAEPPILKTTTSSISSGDDGDYDSSTRRRAGAGSSSRRRQQGHNHHRHHHHRNEEPEVSGSRRRPSHHHHSHRHYDRDSSDERPYLFGGPVEHGPGHHGRPSSSPLGPGFGLFNSGPTGTGFDLLNPFSGWLDDITKPRPSRPLASGSPVTGTAARPSGHRPVPVEGDYNEASGQNDHRDHPDSHGYGHRPSRDDYDNHHHCHHDHDHDHDHDYDHRHRDREPHRPPPREPLGGEPYRPPPREPTTGDREPYRPPPREPIGGDREPYRPPPREPLGGEPYRPPPREPVGGDREPYRPREPIGGGRPGDYDTYPPNSVGGSYGSGGRRPNRPRSGADERESEQQTGERVTSLGPRRVPSLFSPFESLFGSLDEDFFGIRSSFIDSPFKVGDASTAFDAVISSPKISMPGGPNGKSEPETGRDKESGKGQTSN